MRFTTRQLIVVAAIVLVGVATVVAAVAGADNLAGAGIAMLATVAVVALIDIRRRLGELATRVKLVSIRLQRSIDGIEAAMESVRGVAKDVTPAVAEALGPSASRLHEVSEALTAGLALERVAAAERHLEIVQGLNSIQSAETAEQEQLERLTSDVGTIGEDLSEARRQSKDRFLEVRRQFRNVSATVATEVQALLELQHRVQPAAALPPVGGWALEAATLLRIYDLIVARSPKMVVECGSGTSTVWIAYALRTTGSGRVVALEHDADFAAQTREQLAMHGLAEYADVRTAPLVDIDVDGKTFSWYQMVSVEDLTDIDLMLVDGPPKATGDDARFPASLLIERLAPGSLVVVDDADRPDETNIIERWRAIHPGLSAPRHLGGRSVTIEMS